METAKKKKRYSGIAGHFNQAEMKDFFIGYLVMMCVVEGLILFVSYMGYINSDPRVFPWRPYIFASFVTPLAITFMFGLVTVCFNRYFCIYPQETPPETSTGLIDGVTGESRQIDNFFSVMRQVPFLLGLLIIILSAGVIYKIDTILLFMGRVGESAARYFLIGAAVVLAVATAVFLIWMLMSYNLRKKRLAYEFQYKKDVMDKLGLVILDDASVLNQDGELISHDKVKELSHKQNLLEDMKEIKVLPKISKN